METKQDEMEHSKPDSNKEDDASQIVIVDLENADDNNIKKEESTDFNNTGYEGNESKNHANNKQVSNVENDNLPVPNPENTTKKEDYSDVDTSITNLDSLIKDLDKPNRASSDNAGLEIICVDSDSESENIQSDKSVSKVQESLSKKETAELKHTVTNEESSDSSISETTPVNTENKNAHSREIEKKKIETALSMQINKGHAITKPDVMIHIPMGSFDLSQENGISSYDIDSPVKEVKAFTSDEVNEKVNVTDFSLIENNSQNIESDNEQTIDTDQPGTNLESTNLECAQTDKSDTNVLTNNESIIDVDKSKIIEEKDNELSEESDSNTLNNKQIVEINLADLKDDKSNPKMDENKLENDDKNSSEESSCKETHVKTFIQRVNVINIERLMSQKDVTTGTSESNVEDMNVDPLNDNISNEDAVINNNVCHDSAMDNEEKCSNLTEPPNDSINKAEIDADISDANMENLKKDQNQPSTSYSMEQDEEMEVEDSLGLLAESSRVIGDDEDQDQEDDEDGSPDDDDGDFDPDEERNIATVDHSEDSNAHQSESEVTKDRQSFMEIAEETKVDEIDIVINEVDTGKEDADVDFDELAVESQDMTSNDVDADIDITIEEAPIKTSSVEQNENATSSDNTSDIETTKLSDESNDQRESKSEDQPAGFQEKDGRTTSTATSNAEIEKPSPSNAKKLCIAKNQLVVNFVDLEETSSEDDETINKTVVELSSPKQKEFNDNVTNLHIPMDIEIMSTSGGATSEIVTRQGEVVISGVPKARTLAKTARLNTSEVTIKTANTNPPIVIPETKIQDKKLTDKPMEQKMSLEVFNVDSDEEETKMEDLTEDETKKAKETWKCINSECKSSATEYTEADSTAVLFFDASRKRRRMVCFECANMVDVKRRTLVEDFKGMKPLLELDPGQLSQELVEISDSDSDEEAADDLSVEKLGLESGQFLEGNLMDMLNETWAKYDMDKRLKESHDALLADIECVEQECKNIDAMFRKCQINTDKMRNDFYATFEPKTKQLQSIVIFDTPLTKYTNPEYMEQRVYNTLNDFVSKETNSSTENTPSSDAPSQDQKKQKENKEEDDNMEVSVVELSKESAPADLPAPGELYRAPLKAGDAVYARRTAFGSWMPAHIIEIQTTTDNEFTSCRVRFDGAKNATKTLLARYIAYNVPAAVRMTIGTRLIALFKDPNSAVTGKVYYSGVVAEMPNPVNNYRYLVFFDDGYAQYVSHRDTRLVCECSLHVWDEVHPYSRQFVRDYLLAYPERPMVRLHKGQNIKTEWNGKWWISRVLSVDASLVQVYFEIDKRTEWIYRGSTRLAPLFLELQAAERHRNRPNMPRSNKAQPRSNMPYVEYTRPDEQKQNDAQTPQQNTEEIRRQRAVAKKSTGGLPPPPAPTGVQEAVTSRVVYYSPKNAVKPYDMVPHNCGPSCKRTDVLTLRELRTYNPLTKPLLSGWERQIVKYKNNREVMYRAPCGRRIRNMGELHRYLRATCSDMPVDLFDFEPSTHCLAEFVLNRCRVSKKDLSHGKENVPVPCVNYYSDTLPDFCSYNTARTPTAGVPLNLDPEFLCGCDCTDDCQDKTKCACWKMTLEGARTINQTGPNVGYVYKRLPEPLPTGIYECNSRCKCKHTCLNRVAQFPLQLKLQVFKTSNRGWGIRALNDVPKGAFLCVYAGNLLTDATANLDGLNEGDEYLAELDYIEVVEQMKEGYEEDIPDADKEQDKSDGKKEESDEEESSSSEEEATSATADKDDDDFRPAYDVEYSAVFKKTLRKREKRNKNKKDEKEKEDKDKGGKEDSDCITISDDEEAIREPSRFAAESSMSGNDFVSKFRSLRSYFGKDEACYIMDAKVQGNIGRYLNHSCCPNVFVQNVFVDTHDPRFPWVAFFALSYIKAGTELTWNYNYDVGSVPGKVLYCLCRAPNCRGRLL